MEEMMKEYRGWRKMKKKNCLRVLAVMLCLCVLFTANPDVWSVLSVFAAEETEGNEGGSIDEDSKENGDTTGSPDDGSGAGGNGNLDGEEEGIGFDGNDGTNVDGENSGSGESGNVGGEDADAGLEDTEPDEITDTDDVKPEDTAALPEGGSFDEDSDINDEDDIVVQELLARIVALPEAEEILAKEPDEEDEEAYEEWAAALSMYGEEAFAILEAYEELTEEQQTQIPVEAVAKLIAWAELAEVITGGQETYAIGAGDTGFCGGEGYEKKVTWEHTKIPPRLTIGGKGPMADYDGSPAPWAGINGAEVNSLIIGEEITHIGKNAFAMVRWKCDSLIIPASVSSIGDNACPKYESITMKGTDTIPELGVGCFKSDCTIWISNCGYYDAYCSVPGWAAYKENIKKIHTGGETEYIRAKEPTCVEEGNKEYWRCDACGDLFADSEKKNATTLEAVTLPTNDNHSYTYTASGAVITESCANGCGHSATATLSVKSGTNLTYTGSEVKPMTVTYSDGWGGDKSNDTRICYSDNVNVGTAKAELTIGGATAAATFQITEADMEGVTASGYTGIYDSNRHGITVNAPTGATVKYGTAPESCTQTASPTYTDVGVYTVYYQVTKNNYNRKTGSAQVIINARSISGATVTLGGTSLTYNGSEQTQGISTVTVNGKTLTAETDYTVSGNKGTNAKTYTMTLTGKGNYTGTETADFTIAPKALSASMIIVAAGPHYYTGNAIMPGVTVKDGSRTLTKNTDYMVSYKNNTNAGTTATVTITGNGNYTGTASKTFTITYSPLPAGKNLTDYVTVSPVPTDGWYGSEIAVSPKTGCEIGETSAGIGSVPVIISEETGTDGNKKTVYIKDGSGNIYQTEFSYKLDKTPPEIDLSNMSVVNGTKNLWNWIIGRESMIIRIPEADITDTLSGIKEVTYTAVPDSGAQQSGEIRIKSGFYEIALNAEFGGIIRLTAKDKVGNITEVSLTAEGGKVIAENYAPVVKTTLPDTPMPNDNGWYNETVSVTVTVTDDKDDSEAGVISGGIAEIVWKDGENGVEQTVPELPGSSPVYRKEFTISVNTDGVHTYYIKASDNAGNESGWQTVTVKRDTGTPVFSKNPAAANHTQEGADITFTPSEGGKVYWLVDPENAPTAQEVAQKGAQNGNVKGEIIGGSQNAFTVAGLTPGETHKVYVVLEDAAGNLSEVKETSFITLQKAPELTLEDIVIDHEKETIKIPDGIGEVEVYTDPGNPSGSRVVPAADGSLAVEPGTTVYVRYPEKTQGGETTPASDSVEIDIPGRPAGPTPKQVTMENTEEQGVTVTVTAPRADEEYILVEKGAAPDWSNPSTTGEFAGADPGKEYDLWVRKKATGSEFASDPVKTEIRTPVTIKSPAVTGEGAGEDGNTAPKPAAPDPGNETITFTGTYGEECTPVIKVDGQEITPEMTWDEGAGKGKWDYAYPIPAGTAEVEITVEFRKRALLGITVTPNHLTIHADHAANQSAAEAGNMAPLTTWLEGECRPKAAYDNKTEELVQGASYATTDQVVPKGGVYNYIVSAVGKTAGATLTVLPVNAAVTAPDKVMRIKKSGGYTQAEVAAWLPAQAAVTYTGTDYQTKTEKREAAWNTADIGADFGGTVGEKTVSGTVDLPEWATGQTDVNISIEFTDKKPGSGDKENSGDGNNESGEGNGGLADNGSQPPVVNPPTRPGTAPVMPSPSETAQPAAGRPHSGQGDGSDRKPEESSGQGQPGTAGQQEEQTVFAAETDKQAGQETAGSGNGGQTEDVAIKTVEAAVDDGKIILPGETVSTGNVAGMKHTSTVLELGKGAVFVTIVCDEEKYTAGVKDTAAVANAVLSQEHMQLVNDGETIEIRVDVKDISQSVPQRDQVVIENGIAEYRKEIPDLVLGRHIDISMFMKLGQGDWNAINSTEEPIEVVIGIPEDLQEEGREYYIIRAHEGEHTLMRDLDEAADTVTIRTDMFSSYAIAYVATGTDGGHKCSLCRICPTFLGICCFIWLAVVTVALMVIALVVLRRKRSKPIEE